MDNWSVAFDLAIMAGTARMLLVRLITALWSVVSGDRLEHGVKSLRLRKARNSRLKSIAQP